MDLGERGIRGGTWRSGGKESFGWDILYERISKHLKKDGRKVSA